ncbi:MAG: endonuclease/exonuclease/phosphatase family protein [Planctomycetes bacterium]|nr:endonuclease/exonuclease/phosphatase family protein [Planctomycetota bacterium]
MAARKRKSLIACGLILLATVIGAAAYPRWGWWVASFAEARPAGPWRMPNGPVNVVTYNIKFGEGLDEALAVVLAEKPDIVCLQETRPSQTGEIEKKLGMEGYWTPSSNLIGDAAWGNSIFVRGKLGPVEALRTDDGKSFGVWGAAEVNGGRFIVASVHLMHFKKKGDFGVRQRLRETRAILKAIEKLDAPAIVAGDFNEPTVASFIHPIMRQRFENAVPDCAATLPANMPVVCIDFVYCTREWEALGGRAIGTAISDHRPVVARVGIASDGK